MPKRTIKQLKQPLTENGYTPEYEKMILNERKAMKAGKERRFKTVKELMADLNN